VWIGVRREPVEVGHARVDVDQGGRVDLRQHRIWRSQQAAEYLALGVRPTHGLIFTAEDGRPLWPQRVTARFRAISDELGPPPVGVHRLRHSAGTWMIGAGVNPKVVAQRLGGANVSVTLSLHNHVMPGHDQAAADAFASALASAANVRRDHSVTAER
jgi:integrase